MVSVLAVLFLLVSPAFAKLQINGFEYENHKQFVESGRRCGVKDLTPEEAERAEVQFEKHAIEAGFDATHSRELRITTDLSINIYWHLIYSTTDEIYDNAVISEQVNILNQAFAAVPGSYGFSFNVVSVDRTMNLNWFMATQDSYHEHIMKQTLRKGGPHDLNIYTTLPGNGALGWATYPNQYKIDYNYDGVVISYTSLPYGSAIDYNFGHNLVHQIGHWLGLYHTYQGGCTIAHRSGDWADDTAAELFPTYGCPEATKDTCIGDKFGGSDPIHNYMDLSIDICTTEFTHDQRNRMHKQMLVYRNKKESTFVNNPIKFDLGYCSYKGYSEGETCGTAGYHSNSFCLLDIEGYPYCLAGVDGGCNGARTRCSSKADCGAGYTCVDNGCDDTPTCWPLCGADLSAYEYPTGECWDSSHTPVPTHVPTHSPTHTPVDPCATRSGSAQCGTGGSDYPICANDVGGHLVCITRVANDICSTIAASSCASSANCPSGYACIGTCAGSQRCWPLCDTDITTFWGLPSAVCYTN